MLGLEGLGGQGEQEGVVDVELGGEVVVEGGEVVDVGVDVLIEVSIMVIIGLTVVVITIRFYRIPSDYLLYP